MPLSLIVRRALAAACSAMTTRNDAGTPRRHSAAASREVPYSFSFPRPVPAMPPPRAIASSPVRPLLPLKVLFPLVLGVALSMGILVFSELGFRRLEAANRTMAVSLEMQSTLHEILALIVDAETSQRGYVLTDQPEYLDPYRAALPKID